MATQPQRGLSDRIRARGTRVAGVAIILLSIGAALLPAGKSISSDMIGALLIAAGLIELIAGALRRAVRPFAMAAGVVTALAGLLFVTDPETHFFPRVVPIIGWLLLRSLILIAGSHESSGSVRTWTALSAGMDFLLALLLAVKMFGVAFLGEVSTQTHSNRSRGDFSETGSDNDMGRGESAGNAGGECKRDG